jgi:acetyl-CoA carboxylase beta subunit
VSEVAQDPLKFRDGKCYTDRTKTASLDDAVLVGEGMLEEG